MFCVGFLQAQTSNPFELVDSNEMSTGTWEEVASSIVNDSANSTQTIVEEQSNSSSVNPFKITDSENREVESSSVESTTAPVSDSETMTMPTKSTSEEDVNPFSLQTESQNGELKNELQENTEELVVQSTNEVEEQAITVKDKEPKSNIYVFWISILSGLILSILLTINRGVIVKIWKGIKNNNFMILFQKEERNGNSVSFGLLYLCFILNVAAFITMIVRRQGFDFFNQSFFKVLLLVIGIVVLRHLIMIVMRLISNAKKEINNYYFSIISVNSLLGIVLIPINLLFAFGPHYTQLQVVILGVVILIGCLVLKWIKGITNSLRLIFTASFHFFLYLCTAEMLPLLIGIRIYLNLI